MRRLFLSLTAGLALGAWALEMPSFFSDDMILQRESPVPVWGTAPAGQRVTVEFGGATAEATANADGAWLARLPAMPASKEGRELKVTADTERTFRNVVVGDIWLCAGQSNMDWNLGGNTDGGRLVKESANPHLRLLQIPHLWSRLPCRRFGEAVTEKGQPFAGAPAWRVCGPRTSGGFSAVGYLTGRELQRELDIPVGLVKLAWGGCRVESMCAPDSFAQIPGLAGVVELNRRLVAEMQAKAPDGSWQTDNETLYRNVGCFQAETKLKWFDNGKYRGRPFEQHWYMYEHILDVLDGKANYLITEEQNLEITKAIECFYRSAETAREVTPDELL